MLKLSKNKVISVSFVLLLAVIIWPVYTGFAHKGKVPFPPFYQFMDIPKNSPTAQTLHQVDYKETGNQALDLLTRHKTTIHAPGISAAVAINGELTWAGVSGWSDIATKTPVTTDSQFRIGSTAKALTGTALARMVDANLIKLDNPISHYMAVLPNQQWRNITPRQLASHMSGLPHYKRNTDYMGLYKTITLQARYDDVEDALTVFDGSELLFEPGSNFSYSSFGTVLLSAVMKNAAHSAYLDIMQKQVFDPLAMQATMAEYKAEDSRHLASFYLHDQESQDQVRKWRTVDLSHRLAGGGFISTSSDLVKLGAAFLQDDFISSQTRDTFWTPQTLPDGNQTPNGYALGWRYMTRQVDPEFGDLTFANHGGVSRGAQSWLMVIPEHNMSIAVNINANTDVFWDFGQVSLQLAKMFILAKTATQ